jgi:hypothetical protein
MDYGYGERRTTKKDLKRKRGERVFKRGGKFRTTTVSSDNNSQVKR